jgi:hypothetical protein
MKVGEPIRETFTIHVYVRSDAEGLHLDCTGLEPARRLVAHISTPGSEGSAAWVGTMAGVRNLSQHELMGEMLEKLREQEEEKK